MRVYRPPLADQFEWTFPVEYKRYGFLRPLPEARAVMKVIDRRPLDLYMGLHDSAFCGGYFYLSAADAELQGDLASTRPRQGSPRTAGSPRCRTCAISGGIFRAFSLADDYDYYERYGADPAALPPAALPATPTQRPPGTASRSWPRPRTSRHRA